MKTVTLKVRTGDEAAKVKEATFTIQLGENLKENVEKFGQEIVNEKFEAAAKIAFQGQARTGLINNDSLEAIQEQLNKCDLTAIVRKVSAAQTIIEKVKSGQMTKEEAIELLSAQMDAGDEEEAGEQQEG